MNMEAPKIEKQAEQEKPKFDFQSPRTPHEWMFLLNNLIGKNAFGIEVRDREAQTTEISYADFSKMLKERQASFMMISATKEDNEMLEAAKTFLAKIQRKEKE